MANNFVVAREESWTVGQGSRAAGLLRYAVLPLLDTRSGYCTCHQVAPRDSAWAVHQPHQHQVCHLAIIMKIL